MSYNPNIHHRKSIRLKGYDYSQAGLYFITICIQDRKCLFGKIANDEMILNVFGIIAHEQWIKLAERFTNFQLDIFQIMPNHMHGIILLTETTVGAGFTPAQNAAQNANQNVDNANDNNDVPDQNNNNATDNIVIDHNIFDDNTAIDNRRSGASLAHKKTIGDIVGAYKSLVANECLMHFKLNRPNEMMGKLWQRDYYEHIIRDKQSYNRISNYIITNPKNWKGDKFN